MRATQGRGPHATPARYIFYYFPFLPFTLDVPLFTWYVTPLIRTFRDKRTALIFDGRAARGIERSVQMRARAKLVRLDCAVTVLDLGEPPGNRLEALGGDRAGSWSIRVNGRWRICFRWEDGDAFDVELVDYH